MKKIATIFFITIIGIHFISCTVYIYGFFSSGSIENKALAGTDANEFMKFEVTDSYEELTHDFAADFLDLFTFLSSGFYINATISSLGDHAKETDTTHPIYISNHVLRI